MFRHKKTTEHKMQLNIMFVIWLTCKYLYISYDIIFVINIMDICNNIGLICRFLICIDIQDKYRYMYIYVCIRMIYMSLKNQVSNMVWCIYIYLFVYLFIYSFNNSSIYLFIYLFAYSSSCLFICLFTIFIHLFMTYISIARICIYIYTYIHT